MAHFILLTGLIGAGKSTVADLLRKKHYIVVDSDSEAKALYRTPEVFRKAVSTFGKEILTDEGDIDLEALKPRVFDHEDDRMQSFLEYLVDTLSEALADRYGNTEEIVFVEAACTPQLDRVIFNLSIHEAIYVNAPTDVRYGRLQNDRNMTLEDIKRIAALQKWSYYSAFYPEGRRNHLVCYELRNSGDKADLPEPLDEILARDIAPTPRQKYALYERYLRESPHYCKENAWCYSFYNMGGCTSCPFPCGRRQALFERAEGLAAESDTAD